MEMEMKMEMNCTVDDRLRKQMQRHGIVAESRVIEVADVTKNKEYQTRESGGGGVDEQTVLDYAARMRMGDVFPELLLVMERDLRVSIVCGAHRVSAMRRAGITSFRSMVVTAGRDIWQLRALSAHDNNLHGRRQSNAAGVEIAANELLIMPCPAGAAEHLYAQIKMVADRYQVMPAAVKKNYYVLLAKAALIKLGVKPASTFGMAGTLEKLWANYGNAPAFAAIARAATEAGSRAGTEKLLDQAKKNKTPHEQIPGLILDAQLPQAGPIADPTKNVIATALALSRAIGKLYSVIVENNRADEITEAVTACQTVYAGWLNGHGR